jgi:Tfp pilus assembly protein PilP
MKLSLYTLFILLLFAQPLSAANRAKDPFIPLATNWSGFRDRSLLQQYELAQLRVIGVMYEIKEPRVLLQDPSGLTHIATIKNKIGKLGGRIVKIEKSSIVVREDVAKLDGGQETRFITMNLNR